MQDFIFDLQRFDAITIPADDTYELDGVTYTATTDAVFNLDDGKISGLASGKITAVVTGKTNPQLTVDATDNAATFALTGDGENLTLSKLLNFKLTNGEFNLAGNTFTAAAGSDATLFGPLADNASFENVLHFDKAETYIFTSTSFSTTTEQSTSKFSVTVNGKTNSLTSVQRGTVINNFTERGFTLTDESSITATIGNYTLTATATDGDAGGNIQFGTDGITFTPNANDGKLNVALSRDGNEIISGELECTNGSITIGYDNSVSLAKDTSFNFTRGDYTFTATATDDASAEISLSDNGITFTPKENDGALDITVKRGDEKIFSNIIGVSGGSVTIAQSDNAQVQAIAETDEVEKISVTAGTTISLSQDDATLKLTAKDDSAVYAWRTDKNIFYFRLDGDSADFDVALIRGDNQIVQGDLTFGGAVSYSAEHGTLALINDRKLSGDSFASLKLGNYTINAATPDKTFILGIKMLDDGKISVSYPVEEFNAINLSINRGDIPIFGGKVSITGEMIFDQQTQSISLTDGTKIQLEIGNYELGIEVVGGDASSVLSLTNGGIAVTPNTGDGTLDLTLKNAGGSMNANLEVLSGSFILGDGGKLTVTKGTEIKFDFGGGHVVDLKATDDAGGKISLGADGITFAPNSGDGSLDISITRNGETRTANLNMTGAVTYKLDGSISFADGTVVGLTWTDGINLKLKSSGSSGSILLDPDKGIRLASADKNLDVILTTTDGFVTEITSIEGYLWYKAGTVTLDAGTVITGQNIVEGRNVGIRFEAVDGDASLHFANEGITYSAGTGKNFVTYTLGNAQSSFSVNKGSVFIQGRVFHVAEGSDISTDFKDFVAAQYFMLEKEGTYMINGIKVITSSDDVQVHVIDDDTISFANDAAVKVSSDGNAFMLTGSDDAIQVKVIDNAKVTSGSITYDNATKKVAIAKDTTVSVTQGDRVIKLTAPKTISATYKVDDGISYFDLDSDATAKVSVTIGGQTAFAGDLTAGGVLSYNPASGTFGLTGANSSHGDGTNTFAQLNVNGYEVKMATNDTTVVFVPTITDGRLDINFPNERKHEMLFTLSKDGSTIMEDQAIINGTVGFDLASKELHFTKGTVLTLGSGERSLEITALDDASGQLTFTDSGIRFAPNAGDGQLELNFVASDRKANIDVSSGALILNNDRTLSLEKGTVVNLTWEDGTKLTLTASDTGGSIGFDEQGLKVSSDGELSIDLTAGDVQTTLTGLNGTIHYNAGKVLFDKDSTLTATSTLGGQPVNITLESNGTGGYLEISAVGTNYVAGTGALAITWSRGDKSSTFSVSDGSVYIGHGIFRVAEGTTLSTDLKDLVPALYFTTTDAGTYTINGQTIQTIAPNLALTATDDQMVFHTSDDVVKYDGMTFAGDGNVSLKTDNVVLGAGVVANGFGEGNSFVLAEAGNVTADAKIFQLDPLSLDDGREIPMIISVTGAQDGFIFSRTLTEESEEYLGYIDSPYVGSIFTEKFISKGDNSYRIRTDPIGLEDVIGISDGASISGGATLDDEETLSYYVLVTDTTGDFTIGKKTYTLAKGTELGTGIRARFDVGTEAYADKITDLNGTISGDFSVGKFSVNGSAAMQVFDDTDVSISADKNGFEFFGLDKGASLSVSAAGNYVVNSTSIAAQAGNVIVGLDENAAAILVNDTVITGTEKADVLTNAGKNVSIMALGGEDSITNTGANAYVDGGDDEDWIKNYGDSSTIIGGQAKDSITNSGDNVTISGDTGKDSIVNKGDNVSISGGKGKDEIINTGDNVTINGGTGDDEITNAGDNVLIQYTAGDGSDLIYGFNENSTLNISGKGYIPSTVGNDLILTVGYDAITLKDAASLTTANIVGTIDTSHEPEEILKNTVGLDVDRLDTVEVTNSESLDAATSDGSKVLEIADGVKDVDLSGSDYPQVVSLTGGNQNVQFNDAGDNAAIVDQNATGWKNISFGKGDDVGIFKSSQTVNRVSLGAGNDSIFVDNGAKVRVDMSGADAAKIIPWSGRVTLENYDASTGAGFVTDYADILEAVDDGKIYFDADQMSVGSAVVNFNGVNSGIVNFFDAAGKLQKVGQVAPYESLDLSAEKSNVILTADKNSTLTSGTGDDTIFAFAGSLVNAGAGKNSIYIEERDENSSGVTIQLDDGKNTIENFHIGFDFDSDILFFGDGNKKIDFRFDGNDVTASVDGGAQVTLNDVAEDDADFAEILISENTGTTKIAVLKENTTLKVDDLSARAYVGKNSGVDFSNVTKDIFASLGEIPDTKTNLPLLFSGINYIAAGDGLSTLIGNSEKNTLVAGNGYGSLWGGKGDDKLIGQADSSIKNGMTSFFFFADDGNDTVSNFEFITRENKFSGNADELAVGGLVTRASLSGDNVVMRIDDENSLTLENAKGKDFRLNDLIVKVDKNIAYDGLANCYVADGGSSLTVDSTVDSAEIWLDSSHGNFFFGNIRTLDASAVEGRTSLAGYVLDETIIAGHGDSSLWGGVFGDDLLIGGESKNTFFYHLGEGNDTIQGAKEGDIVDLNTLTINQVVGEIGTDGVVLRFTDGGSLTVDSTDVEFRINNDGTTYFVDNGEWKTK